MHELPLDTFLIAPETALREVMLAIDRNTFGIALVVDRDRRLLATVTDGDIRRGLLRGCALDTPVSALLSFREAPPVTAPPQADDAAVLALMAQHSIRQVPLVDDAGHVLALRCREQLPAPDAAPRALVMAGGFGKRLRPFTDRLPKPLLPVGARPLLQRLVEQLHVAGVRRVSITTHFKGELIRDHFRAGEDFGLAIDYLDEDVPLGTAGALALMDPPEEPLLVINGDILTRLDFRALRKFHAQHQAAMTIGVARYDQQVPYGVVQTCGVAVTAVTEKPVQNFFILAGVYLIASPAWAHLRRGEACDMPELIRRALAADLRVLSYPITEYWLDIGQPRDYERALADVASGRF